MRSNMSTPDVDPSLEWAGVTYDSIAAYCHAKLKDIPFPATASNYQKREFAKLEKFVGTRTQLREANAQAMRNATSDYLAARAAYRSACSALDEEFHQLLAREYGTQGNPKEALLFSKAYLVSPSAGYADIEGVYSDLADLIR
jgi:hypothetical protein